MIRSIRLTNFMSHTDTTIELPDGLTVVVGPNNCGKSAIVEALRGVCENTSSDYMIRHGCREARVTVTTAEGDEIEWIRRKASSAYRLNGVEYSRLGKGGVPDEVRDALRLDKVEVSATDSEDVHIGTQKEPIFLLNRQKHAAAFFASVSDAGKLREMQRLHGQRHLQRERELVASAKAENQLLHRLSILDPVEGAIMMISGADELAQQAAGFERSGEQLVGRIAKLGQAIRFELEIAYRASALSSLRAVPTLKPAGHVRQVVVALKLAVYAESLHQARVAASSKLTRPPTLADTRTARQLVDALDSAICAQVRPEARLAASSGLTVPPTLSDTRALNRVLLGILRCRHNATRHGAVYSALETMRPPAVVQNTEQIRTMIGKLMIAGSASATAQRRLGIVHSVQEPPPTRDISALSKSVRLVQTASEGVAAAQRALSTTEMRCQEEYKSLEAACRHAPPCPVCGQPRTLEQTLAGAGSAQR